MSGATERVVRLRLIADSSQLAASTRTARTEVVALGGSVAQASNGARAGAVELGRYGTAANMTRQNLRGLNNELQQMPGLLRQVAGGMAAVGAAAAAKHIAELADAWTNLTSKLRLVSTSESAAVSVREQLYTLSQKTRSELASTSELYTRLTRSTTDLNLSEQQRLRITETINKAYKISGATTQEAAGSIVQLSQALAAGALRGEEFNSVNEQAPLLLDLVARSMGKTRGELKQLASDGQISARMMTTAFLNGGADIDRQFGQMAVTIGGALTQLGNAWQKWVGEASDVTGAASLVAGAIAGLSKHLNELIYTVTVFATAWGVRLLAAFVLGIVAQSRATAAAAAHAAGLLAEARAAEAAAVAELRHAQALYAAGGSAARVTEAELALAAARVRTTAATTAATAAAAASTTVMGALGSTMLSFVGGPIGAIILGLSAVAYGIYSAIQAERQHNRALDESIAKTKETAASLGQLHANWTALANTKPVSLYDGMQAIGSGADMLIEKSRQLGQERQRLAMLEAEVQRAQTSSNDAAALQLLSLAPRLEAQQQRVASLAKEVDNLRTQWLALGGDIHSRLTPALGDVDQALDRLGRHADLGNVLLSIGQGAAGLFRGAQIATADAAAQQFIDDLKKKSKEADEEIKKAGKSRQQLARTMVDEGLASMKAAGMTEEYIKATRELGDAYVKKAAAIDKAKKSHKEEQSEAEKYLTKLREEVRTYGERTSATLRLDAARKELSAGQREEATRLAALLVAWDQIKAKADESAKAWKKLAEGNVELGDEIAKLKDQLAGLSPAQIEYNNAMRETNRLVGEALVLGPPTGAQQDKIQTRLKELSEIKEANLELDRRQAISSGESLLHNKLGITNNEYAKRNALLRGNLDLSAALNSQSDRLSADSTAQAKYNEGVREANDLAERAIALGFEQADVQALLQDRLEKLAKLRDGDIIENFTSQFSDTNTFDQLVEAIGKVEVALDEAIGEGATEKVAKLSKDLGNLRHAMITGIVTSSQAALRSMQTMTRDGSRSFQAMQIAIDALSVVQAISAVLNQGQGDPYTAFARMAAMAAAVAALGVSIGNFGSSGFTDTAAQRQEKQGTGTVLGDAAAKSESIANATEITAKATTELVGINRGMLDALRALSSAIGAAVVGLARGAGNADFSGMNLAAKPFDFKDPLTQWVLGGSSRVTDQGLVISGGALNQLLQGVRVSAYQEVQSRSWAFGSRHTNTGSVDVTAELGNQFRLIIGSITETVRQGALALGMLPSQVEAAIAAFRVEEIRISLKGLTAEEQQAELQAVFSSLFDGLAGSVVPFIGQFQQVGEGLGETLVRVATEVQVMQHVFEQFGLAVDMTDPEKFAQLADGIVQAAGGLDEAQELFSKFFDAFYDKSEQAQARINTTVRARDQQLGDLGLTSMSKDQFRAAFERAMPKLTPEEIVQWLRVGELVAAVEDTVASMMDKFRKAFYSPLELQQFNAGATRDTSNALLEGLGLSSDTTMEQFRTLFEQRLPKLSDEARVEWLRAAEALAAATSAQEQYNAALEKAQSDYQAAVDGLHAELRGSEFTNAVASVRQWQRQTEDGLNAAARAAGRTGAAERDLALVREVAEQRIRAATAALMQQTASLIEQLRDLDRGGTGALDTFGSNMVSQIDSVAAAADGLWERQRDAIKSIQEYLDSMLLGDLGGLTPEEQIAEARRQLLEAQAAAMGGDAEAAAELPRLAEAYLRLLRGSTASGTDFASGPNGANWVRDLLAAVVAQGPRATQPGDGSSGGYGGISAELAERDRRVAAQEAAHRAELAQQLAIHLRDLAGAVNQPVLQLMDTLGYSLGDLARNLGIDLNNITGASVTALGSLADMLGIRLGELTHGLGLELTDLGGGLTQLTHQLGIDFDNLTGVQLQSLASLAESLGLSLTEITAAMGLNLTDLSAGVLQMTQQLGINLDDLTVSSTQSLAGLAQQLGADLSELSTSVGVDLGSLADGQSLLNQALAATIDDLPAAQRDQLAPLLQAITNATSEADANAAIAALEGATNDLPAQFRNQLAPYLANVFPASATSSLDYLEGIYSFASAQADLLAQVRDQIHALGAGQNLPGFAVGTSRVPYDMAAMIHRDEMIIDPETSRSLRRYGISVKVPRRAAANDDGVVDELRALRAEVAELRQTVRESGNNIAGTLKDEGQRDRAQRDQVGRRMEDAMKSRSRGHG